MTTLDAKLSTATDVTGVFLPSALRRDELLADILATAQVPGGGEIDAGALQSRTSVLRRLAATLAEALPSRTERLLTVHSTGTALTTAIALHTGLPFACLDGQADDDARLVGELHRNERVGLVIPVTRTGGSALSLARRALAHGARPAGVFAAVDQDQGAAAAIADAGHTLHALYTVPLQHTRPPHSGGRAS